jgi:hypothetical protein
MSNDHVLPLLASRLGCLGRWLGMIGTVSAFLLPGFVAAAASAGTPIPAKCRPDATTLCLKGGRLEVHVAWDLAPLSPRALAMGDSAGAFFESGSAPSLVVNLTDGRSSNGHFWLAAHSTPSCTYLLTLTDLVSGEGRTYHGDDRRGIEADVLALAAEPATEPPRTEEDEIRVRLAASDGTGTLAAEDIDHSTVSFHRPGSRDPELLGTVLDGRGIDGSWWLLATAMHAGAWDVDLTDPETGQSQRVHVTAAEAGTQRVSRALAAASGVHVTLDTARAVKATVSPSGGRMQAVAANGTHFILTIPPGALVSSEVITLTPIKAVQHLPLTSLAGGVEIGPQGLRFGVVSRLAIDPPQAVALAQETTFAYRSGGSQFFLYPANINRKPIVLEVLHAGGYGLAHGTAAQQATQSRKLPSRAEDQFDQRLWHEHWQLRQGLKFADPHDTNDTNDPSTDVDAAYPDDEAVENQSPASLVDVTPGGPRASAGDLGFFEQDYARSLEPTLEDIAGSCAGYEKWGFYARNFVTKSTADGLATSLSGDIGAVMAALTHGEAHCYTDATTACLAGDHTQPVTALMWWGQLQQDQATSLVDPQKLASCLVFDFELDTLVLHSNPAPEGYLISASHRIDTHALIHFTVPTVGQPQGTAPPTPNNYESAKWLGGAPKNCTITATGRVQPDNLTVSSMKLDGNFFDGVPPAPTIDLIYSTGNPQMELDEDCTPGGSHILFQGLFAPAYLVLHVLEVPSLAAPGGGLFTYEPTPATWIVKEGALYAVRAYNDTFTLGTNKAQESTDLNLFHKPGH